LPTQSTVRITGESGTGKELCARALHFGGPRHNKPFVAQNCAALPDSILESELFGHVKGAFTHAVESRVGILEAAQGGTLFLDEVGDMSLSMQARLLRFLQEGVVTPVGARSERKVDVRVIAATHRDLEAMAKEKTFREDLFYRLSVVPLQVPPLRERREDIPLLLRHFLSLKAKKLGCPVPEVSREALDLIQAHGFPGNIRELENAVEHALVLSAGAGALLPAHWPERMRRGGIPVRPAGEDPVLESGTSLDDAVAGLEKQWIQKALRESGGNISQTARSLGLSRQGLHNKLARYGIKAEG
jgi:DNA-binding NtrC family response regulator